MALDQLKWRLLQGPVCGHYRRGYIQLPQKFEARTAVNSQPWRLKVIN